MRALVVTCRDPFRPAHNRTATLVRRRRRIESLAPKTRQPFICLLNGQPLLRAGWRRRVRDGDTVGFVLLPQGGGGGSNPMKIILSIGLALIAPQLAVGLLGPELAATTVIGSITMGQIVGGVIGMVGNMLINALIPPPKPSSAAQFSSAGGLASPSPTYSIGAQGNLARLGQPIPSLYGRHIIYPDFAAAPYVEYAGNEQYLYQMFVIGQGEYDIEAIRIEDTSVSSFEEITYEIVEPGGSVTLFPTSVTTSVEVGGQELDCFAATYSRSGTTVTVTKTAHGLAAGAVVYLNFTTGTATTGSYTVATVPDANTFTVTDSVSGATSGNARVSPYIGHFTANAAGSTANTLAIDVVMPRGLYYANDSGGLTEVTCSWNVEARQIDDAGVPLGDWVLLGSESHSAATTTPQRLSFRYGVAYGRYEVRLARTDAKQTNSRYGHEINWAGLRAYLPGTQTYGNVTVLAMRMRATNNLSQVASRKVNVIATRKLPTWSAASGWSATSVTTRNPAWAFADVCRASYGGELADARIDLAGLEALASVWEARGDRFDGVFDAQGTVWEALTQIARAGRGAPYLQGGIVHCVRDAAETLPAAMFTQRNIARNSLSLQYLMPSEETADAVDVSYFDATTWTKRTVRATLDGGTADKPARVELFGVTGRDQAWREGMYIAASNRYRRRLLSFVTEMEGFIPALGDLIAVQHDMPRWGQSGEIVSWTAGTKTATLSEPLDWSAGGAHVLAFRTRDGSPAGPYSATIGSSAYHVALTDWVSGTDPTPDTGADRERSHFAFGPANAQYILCRVLGVKPKSTETVEIAAVVESDYVHTADTGTTPTDTAWQLPSKFTTPVVLGLIAYSMPDAPSSMVLSWQPAPGADHYLIEQSNGDGTWTRCGEVGSAHFSGVALYGAATILRVAAVGMTRGPWVEVAYGEVASYMWAPDDTTLMWNADDTTLMWNY